jgi:hypothetical protein
MDANHDRHHYVNSSETQPPKAEYQRFRVPTVLFPVSQKAAEPRVT